MPTKAKIILEPSPTKNARIGQDIEERLPLRWYREGLGGLQVLVILVRRVEELCVGLPHALGGVAADDPSTAAEIEARCPIAQSQQGRRGLGISGLHQNAPHGSFGGGAGMPTSVLRVERAWCRRAEYTSALLLSVAP